MSKIDAKLIQIYRNIEFIAKSGHNNQQNYDYVRAADVVRNVRAALADVGIYAEINMDFVGASYTIARSKDLNAPFSAVNVKCFILLHDSESDEVRTGSGLGTGADLGDKAVYKAQTGALKYALRNALLIPDEEGADPEADASVDRDTQPVAAPAPPSRLKELPPSAPAIPPYEDWRGTEAMTPPVEPPPAPPAQPTREPGDDTESIAADQDTAPTLDELKEFKKRYSKLREDLADPNKGALRNHENLKVDKKVLNFLISVTGQNDPQKITRGQWTNFFERVDKCIALPTGWRGLAVVVDKANGVESK